MRTPGEHVRTDVLHRIISEQLRCALVEGAKRLLVDTDLELSEIARRTGRQRHQHLNHVFKSLTGMPPGACREQFQKR